MSSLIISVDYEEFNTSTYNGVEVIFTEDGSVNHKIVARFNTGEFKFDRTMAGIFTDSFVLQNPNTEVFESSSVHDYQSDLSSGKEERSSENESRLKGIIEKLTINGELPKLKEGALENLPKIPPVINVPKPNYPKFNNKSDK
jgi:hypothetical protein